VHDLRGAEAQSNYARYRPGQRAGHYESFFQRANHPSRPLAFWIRYTLFSPEQRPGDAIGELWAILFDGESGRHFVAKTEVPLGRCRFATDRFEVEIDGAHLDALRLSGKAAGREGSFEWDLRYTGGERPLFLLPLGMYEKRLPRAKMIVGVPQAIFDGRLRAGDREIDIAGWRGSQNHNWGSRHTDHYAWGQVAGFDDDPDAFLEVGTGRIKIGPLWTPFVTPMVIRQGGEELALNTSARLARARGKFDYFDWSFASQAPGVEVEGRIFAPREAFVGLDYKNPPGGSKHCLNSKLAGCELTIRRRGGTVRLRTEHRAAFEILTDDREHGIAIRA
jgi:hypothetical protein